MTITSFLGKLKYGSYKHSKKASAYEEIAKYYRVAPQHVYEIAHGKKVKTYDDNLVFEDLVAKGIIVTKFV